jgi:hypothetical protein
MAHPSRNMIFLRRGLIATAPELSETGELALA